MRLLCTEVGLQLKAPFMPSPVRRRSLPENVLDIQPCTSFDQKPDDALVACQGSLMQWSGVRMASGRIVPVWIFPCIQ